MKEKMRVIQDRFYEGERPLYAAREVRMENVKFYPGESALKESSHIEAFNCTFMCKYPFWHSNHALIDQCNFTVYSRAAIWYARNITMKDSKIDAPKMFREVDGLSLQRVKFSDAGETCWNCRDLVLQDVEVVNGDYIFMNGRNIRIDGFTLQGNYSFQDAKDVVIRNAVLQSKDAFWKTENVTVYDSVIQGEYLGWYSKNLRLVNCTIGGSQPLCYANNLVLENCELLDDCNLAFEYSTVNADVRSHIVSVKNPLEGSIRAQSIGQIIIDEHARNKEACQIVVSDNMKQSA